MENLWTKEQMEALDLVGCKFAPGGSHISRTIMLAELKLVLDAVPSGSPPDTYRSAILTNNVLGKGTENTRQKSLPHLRELYALNEVTPIFGLLRKLQSGMPRACRCWPCRWPGRAIRFCEPRHRPSWRHQRANELKRPAWRRR